MSIWTRVRYMVFAFTDRLLGTRLIDREKARLQRHLEVFEDRATALREQMEDLSRLLHVVQVQLCVLYLRQRHMLRPETWLRFAPAESASEERDLDLLIGRLVKYGLSTITTEKVGKDTYVYHLQPDWAAIVDLLGGWRESQDPATIAWLTGLGDGENGHIHH
jgi:hypothetical protein